MKAFGLIGLGYWGRNIFRNLDELGILSWACDRSRKVTSDFKKRFPHIRYTNDAGQIFNNPEIKAVLIATPATTHFALAREALRRGKDVFVEKPLSLTVKEGQELLRLSRKLKRILMVGHILQYHPAVIKLKEIISQGKLGKIRYIYSNRLNIGKLRTEENILWSFAPHDISAIIMLLGQEPLSVSATGADYLSPGINDVTLTSLEFSKGIKGHIFVSWLNPYKEQKLVVVGSKSMAVFDDVSRNKLLLYPHKIKWGKSRVPVAEKAEFNIIRTENKEPLKLELEHFIDCVLNRKSPLTDAQEGLKVLKVLEGAEASLLKRKVGL